MTQHFISTTSIPSSSPSRKTSSLFDPFLPCRSLKSQARSNSISARPLSTKVSATRATRLYFAFCIAQTWQTSTFSCHGVTWSRVLIVMFKVKKGFWYGKVSESLAQMRLGYCLVLWWVGKFVEGWGVDISAMVSEELPRYCKLTAKQLISRNKNVFLVWYEF